MAIIQPQPKKLKELLSGKRYKVPFYQRPYSWSKDEAEELWKDLVSNKPPYFLGILLLKEPEDNEKDKYFEVVDGQQRLATLILLLRAALETLDKSSKNRDQIQTQFIYQDLLGEDNPDFTLTLNLRDKDHFKTLLNDVTEYLPSTGRRRYASWNRMDEVKNYFLDQFKKIKDREKDSGVMSFIVKNILELVMIDVQLTTDSDVYLFFETLNDRGMELSLTDLVKNRVCHAVTTDALGAAKKIDDISDNLGTGKLKPFLLHYCWALADQTPPPPRKKVMDWYNDIIKKENNEFLYKLQEYADIYIQLIDPRRHAHKNAKEVLTYLDVLGATHCYPLLLVGYKYLSPKDFLRLAKAIELLTVRHTTITKNDTKYLEDDYQKAVRRIRNGESFDSVISILVNRCNKVSDQIFRAHFLEYEPENMRIARYILHKIENYINDAGSGELDWEKLTLEHILAKGSDWVGNQDFKDRLGNMTLLAETRNKVLGNKSFHIKRVEYAKESRILLTQNLSKYEDFTKDTIIEYQNKLADIALKVWNPSQIR